MRLHYEFWTCPLIKASDCFGLSFDESMNKVLQEEQMDVQIRYWNEVWGELQV